MCVRRGCEKDSVMDLTETRVKIEDRGEMTDWVGVGSGRWVGVCRVPCWYLLSPTLALLRPLPRVERRPPAPSIAMQSHAAAGESALKWRGVDVKF